eukprot:CAMPEP_0184644642 /NCGR_PEP_ID=MMETSP0308-20130426/1338_1 /TAXON_ID=38269 /ORGANISM="Gloeochaete witrockiana, Strain SAG 46.84" /LENGTH=276 /DNA_ID=CAMNT_0027073297 /DNA_START=81 /DNA_END=908 /DNA_ORIENTATION=-
MACPFSGAKSSSSGGCPFPFKSSTAVGEDEGEEAFAKCCPVIKTGGLELFVIVPGQENEIHMKNVPKFLAIEDLVQLLMTSTSVTAIPHDTPVSDMIITKKGEPRPYPHSTKLSLTGLKDHDRIILELRRQDLTLRIAMPGRPVVTVESVPADIDLQSLKHVLQQNEALGLSENTQASNLLLMNDRGQVLHPPSAQLYTLVQDHERLDLRVINRRVTFSNDEDHAVGTSSQKPTPSKELTKSSKCPWHQFQYYCKAGLGLLPLGLPAAVVVAAVVW